MRWTSLKKLSSCFLFLLLFSSSAMWSQSPPSSRIMEVSYEDWLWLTKTVKELSKLNEQHESTLSDQKKLGIERKLKLEQLNKQLDSLLQELSKVKSFNDDLRKKLASIEESLQSLKLDLEASKAEAIKLTIGEHVAWGIEGLTGVGLLTLGLIRQDAILMVSGSLMLAASIGHFVALY